MTGQIADGVWPTMITPFTDQNDIDYKALESMVEWYVSRRVAGLFAVCQSSEMFQMSLNERVELAGRVVEFADGRVPVIASGHVSESPADQAEEVRRMADTGVDAVVLVTNRFAGPDEDDEVWKRNLDLLMSRIPDSILLGFYECPFPYKRLLTPDLLRWIAGQERFRFLKDTCCNLEQIQDKIGAVERSGLKLFNANSATLLGSLQAGAAGFSGVMANFHPELYVWLCENWEREPAEASRLQDFLSVASLAERVMYPMSAKYHQSLEGIGIRLATRRMDVRNFDYAARLGIEQLRRTAREWNSRLGLQPGLAD